MRGQVQCLVLGISRGFELGVELGVALAYPRNPPKSDHNNCLPQMERVVMVDFLDVPFADALFTSEYLRSQYRGGAVNQKCSVQ